MSSRSPAKLLAFLSRIQFNSIQFERLLCFCFSFNFNFADCKGKQLLWRQEWENKSDIGLEIESECECKCERCRHFLSSVCSLLLLLLLECKHNQILN